MHLRPIVLIATLGLGLAVASCDKSPTRPSNPTPPTGPGGVSSSAVVRVEISGPASVEPGGSAQLTAKAIKADGSAEDVTSGASWFSSNHSVVQFTAPGLASARARGEAFVYVNYSRQGASREILVLPEGTFRVVGKVTDAGLPLDGVTVTVIGGPGDGLTGVTSQTGAYAIYGVAGKVRLHAKKDGFENRIEDLEVMAHRALDFEMAFGGERGSLSGTYEMTLEASGCNALTGDARRRSYVATVEQHGPRLNVRLSGADFILINGRGDRFTGMVDEDGTIRFAIGDAYYYYYYHYFFGDFDLVERLNSTSALVVTGTVEATSTPAGISGTLNGRVALTQGVSAPFTRFAANCVSNSHRFEMRRQ